MRINKAHEVCWKKNTKHIKKKLHINRAVVFRITNIICNVKDGEEIEKIIFQMNLSQREKNNTSFCLAECDEANEIKKLKNFT